MHSGLLTIIATLFGSNLAIKRLRLSAKSFLLRSEALLALGFFEATFTNNLLRQFVLCPYLGNLKTEF